MRHPTPECLGFILKILRKTLLTPGRSPLPKAPHRVMSFTALATSTSILTAYGQHIRIWAKEVCELELYTRQ